VKGKKSVCIVIGTRPEAIKMAPVALALQKEGSFDLSVLATGQHMDMLLDPLAFFGLKPDFNLSIMRERQSLDYVTSSILEGAGKVFDEIQPSFVLVHGDTTTTFASALAAFYRQIPVGHVEAGLRSHNLELPFPEEMNRVLTDRLSSLWFSPTRGAKVNLLQEGYPENRIWVTGNTVIDALLLAGEKVVSRPLDQSLSSLPQGAKFILVTAHRRESWGEGLHRICAAISEMHCQRPDLHFLIPMHKNPKVREVFKEYLGEKDRVILSEPLDYPDFVWAMKNSLFILSDSGGVQEEASALNKAVLVLRDVTERPEAVDEGTATLVGTDKQRIVSESLRLIKALEEDSFSLIKNNPFGNGHASDIILQILKSCSW
jgi:UDP-N-acetylglucosamine 2-epimerase (non-hydrolysing)